jgi:hypothetical protein
MSRRKNVTKFQKWLLRTFGKEWMKLNGPWKKAWDRALKEK